MHACTQNTEHRVSNEYASMGNGLNAYKLFENVCVHMDFDLCEFYASESSPFFNFLESDSCLVRSKMKQNAGDRWSGDEIKKTQLKIIESKQIPE